MSCKKQTIKIDVSIHELHDVDIKEIIRFIKSQEWIYDAQEVSLNGAKP